MTYAHMLIEADAAARCGQFDIAAKLYTSALWLLLFDAMLPIGNVQVSYVQEKRFECFRRVRRATNRL